MADNAPRAVSRAVRYAGLVIARLDDHIKLIPKQSYMSRTSTKRGKTPCEEHVMKLTLYLYRLQRTHPVRDFVCVRLRLTSLTCVSVVAVGGLKCVVSAILAGMSHA
jgi:hypothetical protein